jgi:hypothetical protein
MPVPFITERLIDAVSCVLIGFLAVAFGRRTGNPIAFLLSARCGWRLVDERAIQSHFSRRARWGLRLVDEQAIQLHFSRHGPRPSVSMPDGWRGGFPMVERCWISSNLAF